MNKTSTSPTDTHSRSTGWKIHSGRRHKTSEGCVLSLKVEILSKISDIRSSTCVFTYSRSYNCTVCVLTGVLTYRKAMSAFNLRIFEWRLDSVDCRREEGTYRGCNLANCRDVWREETGGKTCPGTLWDTADITPADRAVKYWLKRPRTGQLSVHTCGKSQIRL